MGAFILKNLIRLVLGRLLTHLSIDDVLDMVRRAEDTYDSWMKKRSYVYKYLQTHDRTDSQLLTNLMVELGVYLYKRFYRKG